MKALLALEDGTVFEGNSFGFPGESFGEIVFNTSLSGYQEIITDPSYTGQIVAMTYPLIGNYGINNKDTESDGPKVEGLVIKELSRISSNWRSKKSLDEYFRENKILGIESIDTRALTKHIRLRGAMKAAISSKDTNISSLVKKAKNSESLIGKDLVKNVTCKKTRKWNKKGSYNVIVIDCGVKHNILRHLKKNNCRITLVPANTKADQILNAKPDGILVSNGPGDPSAVIYLIETLKTLLGKIPIFGICLGHQLIGLSLEAKSYKLKFGHHGGNHPVKDLKTGKIYITAQNHGFCIDESTLPLNDIEITHINLNDKTLEGIKHKKYPLFSVQFHPESGPGPHEANSIFRDFINMMEDFKKIKK